MRALSLKDNSGFTLIEIIAVLILAGILGAVAGRGIVTGVQGYMLARENAVLAQKAQLALGRMTRELTEISEMTAAGSNFVQFATPAGQRGIGFSDGNIRLSIDSVAWGGGFVLAGDVSAFTLGFSDDEGSPWTAGSDVRDLSEIQITLSLIHGTGDVGALTFTTTVNPRNTGALNGPVG